MPFRGPTVFTAKRGELQSTGLQLLLQRVREGKWRRGQFIVLLQTHPLKGKLSLMEHQAIHRESVKQFMGQYDALNGRGLQLLDATPAHRTAADSLKPLLLPLAERGAAFDQDKLTALDQIRSLARQDSQQIGSEITFTWSNLHQRQSPCLIWQGALP